MQTPSPSNTVFPLAWAEDLPAIQEVLDQELAEVTRREEATQALHGSVDSDTDSLLEILNELRSRIDGFENVVGDATAGLKELDEILATEEETWRSQLAAMEDFRRTLTEWVDGLTE